MLISSLLCFNRRRNRRSSFPLCFALTENRTEAVEERMGSMDSLLPGTAHRHCQVRKCGAACSVVVKLLDLDPQGQWFDP